jgi:hypothetical protein
VVRVHHRPQQASAEKTLRAAFRSSQPTLREGVSRPGAAVEQRSRSRALLAGAYVASPQLSARDERTCAHTSPPSRRAPDRIPLERYCYLQWGAVAHY